MTPRRVLRVVGGGIGAFKSLELIRSLVDAGHEVEVVPTAAALQFVGAASFAAIAGREPLTALFGHEPSAHTRVAERIVVFPATADLMAKLAVGHADDLATTILLASDAPRAIAPAMHTQMWLHPATRRSARQLREDGAWIIGPTSGRLAGGDHGLGRLVDPAWIEVWMELVERAPQLDLAGWQVLVSAGGTREPIDPVRFISNRSSGRQGSAVAAVAAVAGAHVALVTTVDPGWIGELVEVERVERAVELEAALARRQEAADVIVHAAAVADFAPRAPADRKIKRAGMAALSLDLTATPDVLSGLTARRRAGQVVVGFAAETGDPREEVSRKRAARDVDLMVGNDVSRADAGFEVPTNEVVIHDRDGGWIEVPLSSKEAVAANVLLAATTYVQRHGGG